MAIQHDVVLRLVFSSILDRFWRPAESENRAKVMEGLLEMTFRPSQHNVRFRSVFGSISGRFWDHFREVFGHTSGSEGVLKFSSFSVAHFEPFRVHLGSPTAPMLAPFSGPWGVH